MVTPKKIIMKDLELADEEIARLRKENKELKKDKELLLSDYEGLLKDKRELEKENKELKAQIAEYDDLTEELDYRKREAKRLGWNSKEAKNFNK